MRCKKYSTRHFIFNTLLISIPWLSLFFIGKKSIKQYFPAGIFIVIIEVIHHFIGSKKKFWKFYEKKHSFVRDELPFSVGPYFPITLWILKYTFGNFKKFTGVNFTVDALFAFVWMNLLKKAKIVRLDRLNHLQFFGYVHSKAYLLYGFQLMIEKMKNRPS